jgi:hypothetical protein
MDTIQLSRRQAKEADRVGGIELLLPWPSGLPVRRLGDDERVEANVAEIAAAHRLVDAACDAAGLVPVHVRVWRTFEARGKRQQTWLAVTIIGRRWVHARTSRQPRVMYAGP